MRTYNSTTIVAMVGAIFLYAYSSSAESSLKNPSSNSFMTEAAISIAKEGMTDFSRVTSASIDGISSAPSLAKSQKISVNISMQKYLKIAALLRKVDICTQSS